MQDIRLGFRRLRKDKMFTGVAVLTLALGIGANTTMFSVVNSVLLRPLPGYQTGRLVRITDREPSKSAGYIPPPLYLALREQSKNFEIVAGQQFCPFSLTGVGESEQVVGPCTTANWFALQHAHALLGRTFAPDEDQRGRARVVVLEYAFWKRKFQGDPRVIGRTISLNGASWTVIGVMPPGFKALEVAGAPAIFTPDVIADNPAGLIVMARLKPSVSMETARAELRVVGDRLAHSNPATWKDVHLTLTPALEQLTGPQRPLLLLLMGAVCFVLLIACANVANLLLARSRARQHEIGIRAALGASRRRIVRFLLTEVLLICSAASLMAIGMAYLGISVLRPVLSYLPRADAIAIDGRVFVWALIVGWLATLLAGLVPAVRAAETNTAAGMGSRVTQRWQASLLTGEVALALVLLIGAGLLIRTFVNLRSAPLGYDPQNTLTSFLALPSQPANPASAELLYSRIRQRLESVAGVRSVATATSMPTGGVLMSVDVEPEGKAVKPGDAPAFVNIISSRYFRTLGIRIKAGRAFTTADRQGGAPVVIISDSIAKKYFGDKALGRRLRIPAVNFELTDAREVWAEVVGVVENVVVTSVSEASAEHIYLPEAQNPVRFTYLAVHTDRDPMALKSTVRQAVYAESPLTPLDEGKSMDELAAALTASPRRAMWLLGLFAGLAALLSGLGIYAVAAYLTEQRAREIAIRMTMGAGPLSLVRAIYSKPFVSILSGTLLGGLGALGLTRWLESLLFGVSHVDFLTYACAAATLFTCGMIAMVRPTLRAVSMDAAAALRQD